MSIFPGLGGAPSIPAPVDNSKANEQKALDAARKKAKEDAAARSGFAASNLTRRGVDDSLGVVSQPGAQSGSQLLGG